MKEIEGKILEVDRVACAKKLLDLGANKIFDDDHHAIMFKGNDLKAHKRILRLRKEGSTTMLCVKEDLGHDKVKILDEWEVEVSDFEQTIHMLQKLGFSKRREYRKHRVSYLLDNVRFDFDKYQGEHAFVPELLEIEGPSQENVIAYALKIGYKESDVLPWTGKEVLEHYQEKLNL